MSLVEEGALRPSRNPRRAKPTLYLHLDYADLEVSTGSTGAGIGSVERLVPATMAKSREWLDESRVTIQPVLRVDRQDAIDEHDPPTWTRHLVILRTGTASSPGASEAHALAIWTISLVPTLSK